MIESKSITWSGIALLIAILGSIFFGMKYVPLILGTGFIYLGCCITSNRLIVNVNAEAGGTVILDEKKEEE